ncbi:hypothetical protein H0H93_004679 [Arthromyces matolae]|nr:hypothetical protein H0H93_004679 [Arthromyces matolae]
MPRAWLWACLALLLAYHSYSYPVDSISRSNEDSFIPKTERSWLWGWAWGAETAFGAEIHDAILGYVIPLSSFTTQCASTDALSFPQPNTGCPNLCTKGPNQPTEPWIALVQRGECEFVKKVREAQRLGAKAVVVGGENPEISGDPDALVNMYSPGAAGTPCYMLRAF